MSVLIIYKIKGWEMPYTRKKKGDLYWHAALVTGELFLLLWEEEQKVDLSCGCSKDSVPGDVVWHQRG